MPRAGRIIGKLPMGNPRKERFPPLTGQWSDGAVAISAEYWDCPSTDFRGALKLKVRPGPWLRNRILGASIEGLMLMLTVILYSYLFSRHMFLLKRTFSSGCEVLYKIFICFVDSWFPI